MWIINVGRLLLDASISRCFLSIAVSAAAGTFFMPCLWTYSGSACQLKAPVSWHFPFTYCPEQNKVNRRKSRPQSPGVTDFPDHFRFPAHSPWWHWCDSSFQETVTQSGGGDDCWGPKASLSLWCLSFCQASLQPFDLWGNRALFLSAAPAGNSSLRLLQV